MPAERLTAEPAIVNRFDIVGIDADEPAGFIRHVGLASVAVDASIASPPIPLKEMGPPLMHGIGTEVQACIGAVPLTIDEQNRINLFVDDQISEHEAAKLKWSGYTVRPHSVPKRETDGTILYRRYSCAGFVVEAYRSTGLNIVVTTDDELPTITLESIVRAYPWIRDRHRLRESYGLPGDGPWPVLMPGHILRSLARPTDEIRKEPYLPSEGDELFP